MRKVVLAKTSPPGPLLTAKTGPGTNFGSQKWSTQDHFRQPKVVLPCQKWSWGGPVLAAKRGPVVDQCWLPKSGPGPGFGSQMQS